MNIPLFVTYPLRSLLRGGSPMWLAIFCIAIGVMTVVAIQSIGLMASNAYVTGARSANGGDISVQVNSSAPILQSDLLFFEQLKRARTIRNYTPVNIEQGSIGQIPAPFMGLLVQIVDPQQFPLVTAPTFISPASGSLKTLLTGNQVVVTQTFLTHYHKQIGDTFDLQIQSPVAGRAALFLRVRLAGVIANTGGMYPKGNTFLLISFHEYQAAGPSLPVTYMSVDITTPDQAHTDQTIRALQNEIRRGRFPSAAIQTVASLQQHLQTFTGQETRLQELAGLLALLIGGLGIMNTMQVLLARRTLEIAMLKTTGYSRSSLALLFGIETGVLGLLGGVLGTGAAVAVSYYVVTTMLSVPFAPAPWTLGGGMALGTVTALIFGLMPIARSANIRPIQVLRERSGGGGSKISTLALFGIISFLFCALASIVLHNVLLACASVCGTELFLAVLCLCFRPIIGGISLIPLPERWSTKYLIVALSWLVFAGLLCLLQPVLGGLVLACLGLVLMLRWLPHPWKITTRIALRNIGRRPMRTTMLMLILFIGVFVIGTIQVIGQDLQSQLSTTMNQALSYNVIAKVSPQQAQTMRAHLATLPGLLSSRTTTIAATTLVAINGQPWKSFLSLANLNVQANGSSPVQQMLHVSDGVEGYELTNDQLPDSHAFRLVAGRNLNVSDAATNSVLIPYSSALINMFGLRVGSTLTVASSDGKKTSQTLTVVGEYASAGLSLTHVYPLLTSQNTVIALGATSEQSIFYLKVDPADATQVATSISNAVPGVSFVATPESGVDAYLQQLSSIVWVFTVIAIIVLLAGMVIMANAVLLDLLERRRELGILKAIGYTQKTIRGQILLEYGIIGGTSAILAVFLVTLLSNSLGNIFLGATSGEMGNRGATVAFTFSVNGLLLVCLIAGAILLVMITSLLASWRTVQIRPLDVLRYE